MAGTPREGAGMGKVSETVLPGTEGRVSAVAQLWVPAHNEAAHCPSGLQDWPAPEDAHVPARPLCPEPAWGSPQTSVSKMQD